MSSFVNSGTLGGGFKHFSGLLPANPGAGAAKGYYPLRELGSNIEALRFYMRLTPAALVLAK